MSELPPRASAEYLRKHAKRFARRLGITLAVAQRRLANEYGKPSWIELLRSVADADDRYPLVAAVRSGDLERVRRILADGANPNLGGADETPLHIAARVGPASVVEALIVAGALEWQRDAKGRLPLDVARRSGSPERAKIVGLLDRDAVSDPSFRAAIDALHAGDARTLARLVDAEPRLLRERILGPDVYRKASRHQYFRDPKLFWFVANNPTTVERMPPNVVEIARVMLARGIEQGDLDYALELAMSSSAAREQGHQRALVRELIGAGARVTRSAICVAAAYAEYEILATLVADGCPIDATIAAALGDVDALASALPTANSEIVGIAFGLAVIGGHVAAARIALDAGASIDASLPVHAHSTPLHQAAAANDVAMLEFLLARGADRDARDALWDATPLEWAVHAGNAAARAVLGRPAGP